MNFLYVVFRNFPGVIPKKAEGFDPMCYQRPFSMMGVRPHRVDFPQKSHTLRGPGWRALKHQEEM